MSFDIGVLEMQILWLLGKRPTHGYELMKELSEIKHAKITQGTLYPTLAKLEKKKLVTPKKRGTRGKICYALTPKGRKIMLANCAEFVEIFGGIIRDFRCSACKTK